MDWVSIQPHRSTLWVPCVSTGYYASEEDFIQDLKMMWFGLYSRNNNKMDSSGFEHIFAGPRGPTQTTDHMSVSLNAGLFVVVVC